MRSEGLDMVRMQQHLYAIPVVRLALLAGVVVALKDCCTPFPELKRRPSGAILVRLVDMVGEACALPLTDCLRRWWVRLEAATIRTCEPRLSFLAVFGHRLAADWARHLDSLTLGANLIEGWRVGRTPTADPARDSDSSGVGREGRGAGNTGSTLGHFSGSGQSWPRLATSFAGNAEASMTLPADMTICRLPTDLAVPTVFLHTGNLPELAGLVKSGLTPRLASSAEAGRG